MIMKHKRGVNNMAGIKLENNDCPCLRCMYLIQVTRINEESNGNCDLLIHCSIPGCPEGVTQKRKSTLDTKQSEAYRKISSCIEMLKRCIELKNKQSLSRKGEMDEV
jgi:hypothetical protein